MIKKLLIASFLLLAGSFFMTGKSYAQACSAPAQASGVLVEYPGCNGASCLFTQASCSWASQADAVSFNVTVTEVETGTVIVNNVSRAASVTKEVFNITQGRTYKCDVVAVSSCGSLAAAASDQLLCEADAIIDTPTPTTAAGVPTTAPNQPTATPTIAPPGGVVQSAAIVVGILFSIVGGILLFVL